MHGRGTTKTENGIGLPLIFAPFDPLATTPCDGLMVADAFAGGRGSTRGCNAGLFRV